MNRLQFNGKSFNPIINIQTQTQTLFHFVCLVVDFAGVNGILNSFRPRFISIIRKSQNFSVITIEILKWQCLTLNCGIAWKRNTIAELSKWPPLKPFIQISITTKGCALFSTKFKDLALMECVCWHFESLFIFSFIVSLPSFGISNKYFSKMNRLKRKNTFVVWK